MGDQPARRGIESFRGGIIANTGGKTACQLLAQLDAPLVERVQVPQDAQAEHFVFVQRD